MTDLTPFEIDAIRTVNRLKGELAASERRADRWSAVAALGLSLVVMFGIYGGFLDWFAARFFDRMNRVNRHPPATYVQNPSATPLVTRSWRSLR